MSSEIPPESHPPRADPPRSSIHRQIRRARERDARVAAGLDPAAPRGRAPRRIRKFSEPVPVEQAEAEWRAWFSSRGWKPFSYQSEAWSHYRAGRSGLILLPTGSGKTLSALGGALMEIRAEGVRPENDGLRVLYLSPLKALVRDVEKAIRQPLDDLGWPFRVETRTGDTSAGAKKRQREDLPQLLLTTPESLGLLLTEPGWEERFRNLRSIVIDEWHELIGSKRGSLLELMLARLRAAVPTLKTWAVSATIADPELAGRVATGHDRFVVLSEALSRAVSVRSLPLLDPTALPWFGHMGLKRVPEVVADLDPAVTTLLFTNTRSQAERWYSSILAYRPEWEGKIGLHHGSLDREERERVENAVKDGGLPFVVATSSLDLGVDFPTVEKVIQIGSVKGVARATQRAGRAFHRPGRATELTVCPTHFLEYLEVGALRRAISRGEVEERSPRHQPLDVVVQFVLSCAFAAGFRPEPLLSVIRGAYSYREFSDEEFRWVLDFVTTGGATLAAYPRFRKLEVGADGVYRFATPRLARYHRMNMGTIVGESGVQVRYLRGGLIGQIEESFATKLKRGDVFNFSGKKLELVLMKDLVAYVRLAKGKETAATVWGGNSLPISPALSRDMRAILSEVSAGEVTHLPEIDSIRPILEIQARRSAIPAAGETLVERLESKEGFHLFFFTWEGRSVNEGLGHLLAYRLGRFSPNTIAISANDYGFECLGTEPFPDDETIRAALDEGDDLEKDIASSLNYPEMAKRVFREIARISGLIQIAPASERPSQRNLQMSASLLFDVFRNYDPSHPLLREAFVEVNRDQLQLPRLRRVLREIAASGLLFRRPAQLTPFAFPLFVERIRSRVSTETLEDRINRLRKKVFGP